MDRDLRVVGAGLDAQVAAGGRRVEGVAGVDVAVYAVLLIVIVLFMPKGIYGTLKERWRK